MSYTIYDLAKDCGVSIATISRVINNSEVVSEKTRTRVLQLMKEHDYAPNVFARGLNKIGMNIIGVLISDIGNPFFAEIVKSIDTVCQKYQYKLILCSTENNTVTERKEIEMLMQKQVDGFIIAGSRPVHDANESFLRKLSITYPVVLINSYISGGDKLYSVMVDEKQSSYEALQRLVAKGYRNMYLFGDPSWKTTVAKIEALKAVVRDNKLDFSDDRIIACTYSYQSGCEGVKCLLNRDVEFPCLIFCSSDQIAVGAMKELLHRGIRIPEQVGLLGYSNTEISSLVTPSLTTVDQKMELLGAQAARMFIDIHCGKLPMGKKMYSPYEVLLREST